MTKPFEEWTAAEVLEFAAGLHWPSLPCLKNEFEGHKTDWMPKRPLRYDEFRSLPVLILAAHCPAVYHYVHRGRDTFAIIADIRISKRRLDGAVLVIEPERACLVGLWKRKSRKRFDRKGKRLR